MERAVPLSVLVDQAAGDGERDEAFVRGFAHWFGERADRLCLPVIDRLGLVDVLITFRMKHTVRLIITGYPPDSLPGEVTLTIDEPDFPFVDVQVLDDARPNPYEICTLDYSTAGRRVTIGEGPHVGQSGIVIVSATVSGREEHRVRVGAQVLTIEAGLLSFDE
ncbi:MAG: hypothetical protein ACI9OJ_005343 [Myxococcota bacterium]